MTQLATFTKLKAKLMVSPVTGCCSGQLRCQMVNGILTHLTYHRQVANAVLRPRDSLVEALEFTRQALNRLNGVDDKLRSKGPNAPKSLMVVYIPLSYFI